MSVLAAPSKPTVHATAGRPRTAADWWASLGRVPLERIIADPFPGTVSFDDYIKLDGHVDGRPVELVNATLVEKPMGSKESEIALEVAFHIKAHLKQHRLGGRITGADGPLKMAAANVRLPDVCWTSPADRRESQRDKKVPQEPPTLAVEVVSESNTAAEIDLKLREYFVSGCRLAWVLYPQTRTLRVYDAPERFRHLTTDDSLDGGEVLPRFSVRVGELFDV